MAAGGLYPSLEDMKVDQVLQAQDRAMGLSTAPVESGPVLTGPRGGPVYPGLASYMGLEFDEETIRQNMPEYLGEQGQVQNQVVRAPSVAGGQVASPLAGMVAPISGGSLGLLRSNINHGVREVVLCKGLDGKVGLKVKAIDKGVFVGLVVKGSPAALGGLRFGDQILQINGVNVAGFTESKVNSAFKAASVNNIVLAVRDRPFERTLTLHKDSTGHIGFQFKDGEIKAIVVDSSAARNGLLISHFLVEVNGQNVVGISDKEISDMVDNAGNVVTITVIPGFVYKHMIKNISSSLVKKMMDHSIPDI